MNRRLTAYLLLERLMMEADDDGDWFADELRDDHLDRLWAGLDDAAKRMLTERTGVDRDEINPTRIEVQSAGNVPPTIGAMVSVASVAPRASAFAATTTGWARFAQHWPQRRAYEEVTYTVFLLTDAHDDQSPAAPMNPREHVERRLS